MAQEVVVRFRINDNGELEGIANKAEKAAKSTEKLNKSRNRYNKTEKGVGQLTNNSTKAFSKQAQGITSGLVPAYATLAANVFAVSAAFNALERAISAAKLEESLVFMSRQAGDNFKMLSDRLRDVTGNALSAEQAMRAVAFATTSGFNSQQLETFGKIADGAAKALGRNMPDALDRLVRGAAKLEPEILDELGIMVRLDDAAQKYADSLGKNVNELSVFERRMAFANEIMEQGLSKYKDLNNAVDQSPFQRLAATFSDATITALKSVADFFGPIADFLAGNLVALTGTILALGTSVATAMVPSITNGADAMADLAQDAQTASKENLRSLQSFKGAPKVFDELSEKVANGTATNKEYARLKNSLAASERGHVATLDRVTKAHGKNSDVLAEKTLALQNVRNAQATLAAVEAADTQATSFNTKSKILNAAANLELGLVLTNMKALWAADMAATYADAASKGVLTKALMILRTGATLTMFSMQALLVVTMAALPIIGMIAVAATMAYSAFKDMFQEPPSALDEALERSVERMKELDDITFQFMERYAQATTETERFEAALDSSAGIIKQTAEQMAELIAVQRQEQTQKRIAATIKEIKARAKLKKIIEQTGKSEAQIRASGASGSQTAAERSGRDGTGGAQFTGPIREAADLIGQIDEASAVLEAMGRQENGLFKEPMKTAEGMLEFIMAAQANMTVMRDIKILEGSSDEAQFMTEKIEALTKVSKGLADAIGGDEDAVTAAVQAANTALQELNTTTQNTKTTFDEADVAVAKFVNLITANERPTLKFREEIDSMQEILDLLKTEDLDVVIKKYEKAFKSLGLEGLDPKVAKAKFEEIHSAVKKAASDFANEPYQLALYDGEASMMREVGQNASASQVQLNSLDLQIRNRDALIEAAVALKDVNEAERLRVERQKLITKERATEVKMLQEIAARQKMLGVGGATADLQAFTGATSTQKAFAADETTNAEKVGMLRTATQGFIEELKALGPEGELMAAINESTLNMTELFADAFDKINGKGLELKDGLNVVAGVVAGLANIQAAKSKAAIAGVDREIAAEKKRDGKSAASLAKIKALEAKKDKMKRKAFEQDKKAKMASTVINTASGIVAALDDLPFPANIALAGMIGVMGAQQLAVISGMQYQGGGGGAPAGPSKVSVGSRSNTVDLARARSPAGELAFARGASGTGQGMTNYKPTPAFTGAKYRAAGGAAFMIGEQGPEMFVPETPGTIVPADEVDDTRGISGPTNINFTIQAIDGQSVQEMLLGQRGNIIGMIRDAANASGEPFIENVNVLADSEEFNPSLMRN